MRLNVDGCVGCGACYSICPKNSIVMRSNKEGFLYPKVNIHTCINCHMCEKTCPVLDNDKAANFDRIAYACYTKDENIRMKSSSGGIFTELAQKVLQAGGVVFGAAFSDDYMSVNHIAVDNIKDLDKLRGSKYVQSDIGDTYKETEKYLKQERLVFFTGTPCQIAGLKKYLGKDYNNLLTQDLICHGVPSSIVWKKYVKYCNRKSKSNVKKISFRDKKYGWKEWGIKFEFEDNTQYINQTFEDVYILGFLRNLYLRYSCYNCKFKNGKGNSDITLADFWGIGSIFPDMDDDKGTSFVIINSKKGQSFFSEICKELELRETDPDYANKYNSAYIKSALLPKTRKNIFMDIKIFGVFYGIQKNLEFSLKNRIVNKIRLTLSMLRK